MTYTDSPETFGTLADKYSHILNLEVFKSLDNLQTLEIGSKASSVDRDGNVYTDIITLDNLQEWIDKQ